MALENFTLNQPQPVSAPVKSGGSSNSGVLSNFTFNNPVSLPSPVATPTVQNAVDKVAPSLLDKLESFGGTVLNDTGSVLKGLFSNPTDNIVNSTKNLVTGPTATVDGITAPKVDTSNMFGGGPNDKLPGYNITPEDLNKQAVDLKSLQSKLDLTSPKAVDDYNQQVTDYQGKVNQYNTAQTAQATISKQTIPTPFDSPVKILSKDLSNVLNEPIEGAGEALGTTPAFEKLAAGSDAGQFLPSFVESLASRLQTGTEALSGLTGGLVQPNIQGAPDDFATKLFSILSQGVGMVTSLEELEGVNGISAPQAILDNFKSYPKIQALFNGLASSIPAFAEYGQLNPNLNGIGDRLKTLGTDILTAVPYTALGLFSNKALMVPASTALGFGMAKLSGASNKDAIVSGVGLGLLSLMGGEKESQQIVTQAQAKGQLYNEALNTINKFADDKITADSSLDEIKSAFKQAALKTHPDVGGDAKDFSSVTYARDILLGEGKSTESKLTNQKTPEETKADIQKIAEDIKNPVTTETPPEVSSIIKETAKNFTASKIQSIAQAVDNPVNPHEATIQNVASNFKQNVTFTGKDPIVNLKRDLVVKNIAGEKITLPAGEAYTPHLRSDNKILLQDGIKVLVNKSTYETVKQNSKISEPGKPFAPELTQTEENLKGEEIGKLKEKDIKTVTEEPNNFSELRWVIEFNTGQKYSGLPGETKEETIKEAVDSEMNARGTSPKFSKYQLSGGKNYKEILIKAPWDKNPNVKFLGEDKHAYEFEVNGKKTIVGKGVVGSLEEATKYMNRESMSGKNPNTFKSSHWDEPNVIAHIRMNERSLDGKKVAFMEELQSDWAREGRSKGFVRDRTPAEMATEKALVDKGVQSLATGKIGEVPNNPLLKNWQELAIKRALIEAVNSDAKYFAWINGEQTEARYNLSKELDSIDWKTIQDESSKEVNLNTKNAGKITLVLDDAGKIKNAVGGKPEWIGKHLEEAIGKGVSEKIIGAENGKLEGTEMDIKATWAYNLYDSQVRSLVEKLTGQKPEVIDMGLEKGSLKDGRFLQDNGTELYEEGLRIGKHLQMVSDKSDWIVTDVLGAGKFKAVPQEMFDSLDIPMDEFKKSGIYKRRTESFEIPGNKSEGQQAIKITSAVKQIVMGEAPQLKMPSGVEPSFNEAVHRPELPERLFQPQRVQSYKNRLKLEGADPVLVEAIVTPEGNRAYGVSYAGTLTFENIVEHLTEDHEIFHQVFQNMNKMRVFKDFDKAKLLDEARSLYGDKTNLELEENLAKDFQQYVNEKENNKQTSFWGKMFEFFQRLYASLKQMFNSERNIQDFYQAVHERMASESTKISNTAPESFNEQQKNGVVDFSEKLAPNGKKSGLTPEQYKTVRTPEFKKWFGDWENDPQNSSKIVDENGEPLVVYHGTNSEKFDEFNPKYIGNRDSGWFGKGFYFSLTKGEASTYGKNITDTFLNIKKPFDFSKFDLPDYRGYSLADTYTLAKMADEVTLLNSAVKGYIYGKGDESTDYSRIGKEITLGAYKNMVEGENLTPKPIEVNDRGKKTISYKYNDIYGSEQWYDTYGNKPIPNELLKYVLFDKKHQTDFNIGGLYGVERKIADSIGDKFTEELKKLGFDGTIQSPDGDEYIAFVSNQIKSASENKVFSDSNNIHFNEKNPAGLSPSEALAHVEKRVGVKTAEIGKVQNMLNREEISLSVSNTNPEAFKKAYGENRIEEHKEKIADLRARLMDLNKQVKEIKSDYSDEDLNRAISPLKPENMAPRIRVLNKDVKIPEELTNKQIALEIKRESLERSPFAQLEQYVAKSGAFKGELPEVTGKLPTKENKFYGQIRDKNVLDFIKSGDKIIQSAFFDYGNIPTTEEAREGMQTYLKDKQNLKEERKQVLAEIKSFIQTEKDRITLEKLQQGQNEAIDKEQAKAQKILDNKRQAQSLQDWKNFITAYNEEMSLPTSLEEVHPPVVRGVQSPVLELSKAQDKGWMARESLDRNIEKTFPREDATKLNNFLTNHLRQNQADEVAFIDKKLKTLQAKMQELGIKPGSDESAFVQIYGEGRVSIDQLMADFPDTWKNIEKAVPIFKQMYEETINEWNEQREKFNKPAVPMLPNYFPHFDAISFWTKHYGILNKNDDLPTSIAGLTKEFKPTKTWNRHELHRTGHKTDYDAIAGAKEYIKSVAKQMFTLDSIARADAVLKYIRISDEVGQRLGTPLHLSRFVTNLQNVKQNQLASKMGGLDREIEDNGDRKVVNAVLTLSRLIGKNIIAFNPAAMLSHGVGFSLNAAMVDKVDFIKGVMTSVSSPFSKDPYYMIDGQKSNLLFARYPKEYLKTKFETVDEAGGWMIKTMDIFKTRTAVASKYYELTKNGMAPSEAIKEADIFAGKIVGDFARGLKPNLMNQKIFKVIAQFQFGMNDAMSVISHDFYYNNKKTTTGPDGTKTIVMKKGKDGVYREKEDYLKFFWQVASWMVAAYLMDELIYKPIKGSGKGLDPIGLALTLSGLDPATSGKSFWANLGTTGTDLLGELPFANIFVGNSPTATAISGTVKDVIAGNLLKAGAEVAADFISPIGGGTQVQKIIGGIEAIRNHETTGVAQAARALFFGSSSAIVPLNALQKDLKTKAKTAQTKLNEIDPSLVAQVQPIFNEVLKDGFGTDAADTLTDGLTDDQYTAYKAMKSSWLAQNNITLEPKILPIVEKAYNLGFGTDAANQLVSDSFPDTPEGDNEYTAYTSIKNSLYGINGEKNTPASQATSDGTSSTAGSTSTAFGTYDKQSLITHIANIAKALGSDPVDTFNDIFKSYISHASDERIVDVENPGFLSDKSNILTERLPENSAEGYPGSNQIRYQEAKQGGITSDELKDMQLDHFLPKELGGTNDAYNLDLITTEQNQSENSAIETPVANAIKAGTITRAQALEYITRYKIGTLGEVPNQYYLDLYKNKYNSQPITLDQVNNLLAGQN